MNSLLHCFRPTAQISCWVIPLLVALQCRAEVVTPSAVHRLAGSVQDRHPGLQALELRAGAAKAQASCANPTELEGELDLVEALRLKTGPHSDHDRLLHHVRGTRGKLHWAGGEGITSSRL